jgi:hypothetical protein
MLLSEMNDSSSQYFHLAKKNKKTPKLKTKEHDIHNISKVSQKVYVVEC